jgi:hypothetical protein
VSNLEIPKKVVSNQGAAAAHNGRLTLKAAQIVDFAGAVSPLVTSERLRIRVDAVRRRNDKAISAVVSAAFACPVSLNATLFACHRRCSIA